MIAIITARGGSKGLPRRNVLPFCGKPLIVHTIEAAKNSQTIERILVSTDDEIASISLAAGAEIPFIRPAGLSSDTASSRDVLLHALKFLEAQGDEVDLFCLLQPTSPLRTAADIDGVAGLFRHKQANSVLSVTPYEHPIQWAVEVSPDGLILPREHGKGMRRQDLTKYFRPNGAIYVFETDFFKNSPTYIGSKSYGYPMSPERSIDIDTQLDFIMAETISHYLESLSHGR